MRRINLETFCLGLLFISISIFLYYYGISHPDEWMQSYRMRNVNESFIPYERSKDLYYAIFLIIAGLTAITYSFSGKSIADLLKMVQLDKWVSIKLVRFLLYTVIIILLITLFGKFLSS